jgi:hypothetical protein
VPWLIPDLKSQLYRGRAAHANIPLVVLPFSVGGDDQARDRFSLFDATVARLLGALQ